MTPRSITLILGSSSPSRRTLFEQTFSSSSSSSSSCGSTSSTSPSWNFNLKLASPNINEQQLGQPYRSNPFLLTQKLAHAKADALVPLFFSSSSSISSSSVNQQGKEEKEEEKEKEMVLLITSDQVAVYQDEIREKPTSEEECRKFLRSYAKAPVQTVNTVVVTHVPSNQRIEGTETATQAWLPIPEEILDQVIAKKQILNCAGGFMVEEELLQPYLGERQGTIEALQGFPIDLIQRLVYDMIQSNGMRHHHHP